MYGAHPFGRVGGEPDCDHPTQRMPSNDGRSTYNHAQKAGHVEAVVHQPVSPRCVTGQVVAAQIWRKDMRMLRERRQYRRKRLVRTGDAVQEH